MWVLSVAEMAAVLTALILALTSRRVVSFPGKGVKRWFGQLARQRSLAVLLVGLLSAASSAALSLLVVRPQPRHHDEFSSLLAADTFAHGKLTNPAHPLWMHFESFHIIGQPTYASKYPPAQGLALAVGQVLGIGAIGGVWISLGLCCAAVCWMLQAWLPARWAFGGALLATGSLVFTSQFMKDVGYWGQSYWGGAMAACGGALVFGALRRILREPRARHSLILGLGLVVLANSRPFEGLVLSLPAGGLLLVWMAGKTGPSLGVAFRRILIPIGLMLAMGGAAMGWYNYRVTGQPLRMPYQVHEAAYSIATAFMWQPLKPEPEYHHPVMRAFWTGWGCGAHFQHQSLSGIIQGMRTKVWMLWSFYLGVILAVPFVCLTFVLRNAWMRFAMLAGGGVLVALLVLTSTLPHYAAPATCLLILLLTQSMRHLRLWRWRGRPAGRNFLAGLGAGFVVLCLLSIGYAWARVDPKDWFRQRARIQARFAKTPDRHLVIVRYGKRQWQFDEWVYNEADIDQARVVWAREMDAEHNRQLLAYFRDRRVWLLEVDDNSRTLSPYFATPRQESELAAD